MAHTHHRKLSVCPNCQQALTPDANFCPNCGQENHDLRLPFGHVVYEVVEGFTHFDGKLWVTLRDIFTRPGRVPLDFIEGRRQRHVPPIRLYIFVSFLLFLLIGVDNSSSVQRAALRTERLEAAYGSNRPYREMRLKDIHSLLNDSITSLRGISGVALHFGLADSTGTHTLRQWRGFTDDQLDSVLRLYNQVAFVSRRERLRAAIAVLPAQLPWLSLREPANTKELPVGKELLKKAGIDTTLAINLLTTPEDTLRTKLCARLKALSIAERMRYAEINNATRYLSSAYGISVQRGANANGYRQFAKLIDSLKPLPPNKPLRFRFTKGEGSLGGLGYTTEAAARADVVKLRKMTPDEQFAFYKRKTGDTVAAIGFVNTFFLKRALGRYVRDFDKSEGEVAAAQSNTTIKNISYSFFLLMPLVALFLYVFYRQRQKYYYVDHLIFSINMHTVGFLLLILIMLLMSYTPVGTYLLGDGVVLLAFVGPALYFLLSLRRVYQQSWGLTLVKFLGLILLYGITSSMVIGAAFVLGIF
jgi:uncharacterized membrane protein